MREVKRYQCEICDTIYEKSEYAINCEKKGIAIPQYRKGDEVKFKRFIRGRNGTLVLTEPQGIIMCVDIDDDKDPHDQINIDYDIKFSYGPEGVCTGVWEGNIIGKIGPRGNIIKVKKTKQVTSCKEYFDATSLSIEEEAQFLITLRKYSQQNIAGKEPK